MLLRVDFYQPCWNHDESLILCDSVNPFVFVVADLWLTSLLKAHASLFANFVFRCFWYTTAKFVEITTFVHTLRFYEPFPICCWPCFEWLLLWNCSLDGIKFGTFVRTLPRLRNHADSLIPCDRVTSAEFVQIMRFRWFFAIQRIIWWQVVGHTSNHIFL